MAIPLIDKIKPKNNGDFPLVDAEDVLMPDGSRLSNTEMGKPGEPGKDGKDGKDGADGKDGISATHSWSGTTLTIASASGTSSADLKGQDGYTPVRGVDYFNEEDIYVIKGYIDGLFVPLTQEEYDALVSAGTVDPNKYYMIVGDGE